MVAAWFLFVVGFLNLICVSHGTSLVVFHVLTCVTSRVSHSALASTACAH